MTRYRIVKYNDQFAIQVKILGLFWIYHGEYGVDKFSAAQDAENLINRWRNEEKPPLVEVVKEF